MRTGADNPFITELLSPARSASQYQDAHRGHAVIQGGAYVGRPTVPGHKPAICWREHGQLRAECRLDAMPRMIPDALTSPSVWLSFQSASRVDERARSLVESVGPRQIWSEAWSYVIPPPRHRQPGCRWAAVLVPRNDRSGSSAPPLHR